MGPRVPDLSEQVSGGGVIWEQKCWEGWGCLCPLTMLPPRLGPLLDSVSGERSKLQLETQCHWKVGAGHCQAGDHGWKVKVKVAQSCLTLCDPMDHTVHRILQARMLEWGAFPFSRGSSPHRDRTQVFRIAGRFFYQLSYQGNPGITAGGGLN